MGFFEFGDGVEPLSEGFEFVPAVFVDVPIQVRVLVSHMSVITAPALGVDISIWCEIPPGGVGFSAEDVACSELVC